MRAMDWLTALLTPLSGFAVGLIVGLTGVGGGSLMTPLLILVFGIAPATAVGAVAQIARTHPAPRPRDDVAAGRGEAGFLI